MLNTSIRYVFNSDQLSKIGGHVETISTLKGSGYYRPLRGQVNLAKARVLVERHRDRGIGDILFLTGPMRWLKFVSGDTVQLEMYTRADRAAVLHGSTMLRGQTPLCGPLIYDALPSYDYHWMVDAVTEYNEEHDQLNVYDALYTELGLEPGSIEPRFKRPHLTLTPDDATTRDNFYHIVWLEKKIDLRKTGSYVVSPLTYSSLRAMPYTLWLGIIRELSAKRPVIVTGDITARVPHIEMSGGEFSAGLDKLGPRVINMLGHLTLRQAMALVDGASCVVSLDSGLLYVAQALRVPAVSIWGPIHPGVRLGYDKDYMDLTIWHSQNCRHAPCYAYDKFPASLCPSGAGQGVCEVLKTPDLNDVLEKVNVVDGEAKVQLRFS